MALPDSLFNMTIYCNLRGYDFLPQRVKGGFTFNLFKGDLKVKTGGKVYKVKVEGEKEVYSKLYNILKK